MKSPEDIQRAHDLLHAVFLNEIDVGQTAEENDHAAITCTGLCWVLGCPAGELLEKNLQAIHAAAESKGYRLSKAPRPMTREEFDAYKDAQ